MIPTPRRSDATRRAPTSTVRKLADDHGIQVTGRVDYVRPYVRDAAVYVVPLRIGGGTRLKIFEAMAMGKAVVSTTIGAEGLPVRHDEHVMLAWGRDYSDVAPLIGVILGGGKQTLSVEVELVALDDKAS